MEHVDVIIVGAGLSGVGAGVHLKRDCPDRSFAILEGREAIGGTWDLFRYPGIRSDSDMHTLGYDFKPWREAKAIADGPAIRRYVNDTADEHDVRRHIRFGHRVERASWSTDESRWVVQASRADGAEPVTLSCDFLFLCGGYYRYDQGHLPEFAGLEEFGGTLVQPQFWPEDLDYAGKRVIVIGSGATAMTLVPAMAEGGARVTMVQRSPTYVVSRPAEDAIANFLRRILPERWAYALTRWKNVTLQGYMYRRTRTAPEKVKRQLLDRVRKHLGPDYDVDTHFTPRYNPWDQRLCLVPDADLFKAINAGRAEVVTDGIERFTANGIRLASGRELEADIVVAATGLELAVLSGIELQVDGRPVNLPDTVSYKGMMFSDVPNLVQTFGYINASWTLRADLTARYVCRLLNHLQATGTRQVTPRLRDEDRGMTLRPWIDDFSAGYMQRAMHRFPKQGDRGPWRNTQDYAQDKKLVREAPLEDGALVFSSPGVRPSALPTLTPEDAVSAG